jgi:long-chain acyl-CoA synthetase
MSDYQNILNFLGEELNEIYLKRNQSLSFPEILRKRHQFFLTKVAIIERDKSITYQQLWEEVDNLQEKLAGINIQKGDVVAICSPNSLQVCITFLAVWQYGAIPFIVNYKLDTLGDLCLLNIKHYLVPNNNPSIRQYFKGIDFLGQVTLNQTFECYQNPYIKKRTLKETSFLVTSSGSSGSAKIVKLTNEGTIFNVKSNVKALGITQHDITALILPMGYSYGLVAQYLSHLYVGATIILVDTVFFFTKITKVLNHYNVTNLFMVPPMIRQLNYLYNKNFLTIQTPSLRFLTVGGNRIETSSVEKVMKIFSCPIVKTYGLAEAGPRVATNFVHDITHDTVESVGKANHGISIKILKKSMELSDSHSIGIIRIESPSVMAGYFNFKQSAKIKPFESVVTKDIGYKDSEGNLFILGRKGDNFKIDNQTYWFREVENILYKHFPFLKIALQKKQEKIIIKVVAMCDFIVKPEIVYDVLRDVFGKKVDTIFTLEVLKTSSMLNEK